MTSHLAIWFHCANTDWQKQNKKKPMRMTTKNIPLHRSYVTAEEEEEIIASKYKVGRYICVLRYCSMKTNALKNCKVKNKNRISLHSKYTTVLTLHGEDGVFPRNLSLRNLMWVTQHTKMRTDQSNYFERNSFEIIMHMFIFPPSKWTIKFMI